MYGEAEDQLTAEAGAEARFILRELLRAKDDKVRLATAQFLLRLREQQRIREAVANRGGTDEVEREVIEYARYVLSLNEEEADALVDEIAARRQSRRLTERADTGSAASPLASDPLRVPANTSTE